jgi:hypothetical protein
MTRSPKLLLVLPLVLGAVGLAGCTEETNPATNVTAISATLNGSVTVGSTDQGGDYWFEYSSDNGTTWTQGPHHPWGSQSCTYSGSGTESSPIAIHDTVSGLTPGTHYIFRTAGSICNVGVVYGDSNWRRNGDADPPYEYDSFDTPTGPPSGSLAFHDWADTQNPTIGGPTPTGPWDYALDWYPGDDWSPSDTQITWPTDNDPFPRPIVGGLSGHARQLLADPAQNTNEGCSTRTQLRVFSATGGGHIYEPGWRRVTYFDVKLDTTLYPTGDDINNPSGGNDSQVFQIMSGGVDGYPELDMSEESNGVNVGYTDNGANQNRNWPIPMQRGKWYRFAVDALLSTNGGYDGAFRVWIDDGTGWRPVMDKQANVQTDLAGSDASSLSIGPYQTLPSCWPTAPGKVQRRYANVAVTAVDPNAPW